MSDQSVNSVGYVTVTATANLLGVSLPASIKGQSGKTVDLKATASGNTNGMTYQWNTAGLRYQSIAKDTIRITLPEVEQDTTFTISATVRNVQGLTRTAKTQLTVVAPVTENGCDVSDADANKYQVWKANMTYVGGNMVSFNQLVWKAKYWNRNNQPSSNGAWELVSNVTLPWSAQTAYSGGNITVYQGNEYKAKWWTKGDRPNSSSVWTKVGPACQ